MLTTRIEEMTADHQCGFSRKRITTYQIFCSHQILEKKREYNETVNQIIYSLQKDPWLRRQLSFNILT